MIVKRRSPCTTAFSHTTPSSRNLALHLVSRSDRATIANGTCAASGRWNDFSAGGRDNVVMLVDLRVVAEVAWKGNSARIEERRGSRPRVSVSI